MIDAITAPRGSAARRSAPPESEERTIIDDTLQTHLQKASRREWPAVDMRGVRPDFPPISDELTNVPAENERIEDSFDGEVPPELAKQPPMRVVAEPTPTPTPHAIRRPLVLAIPARRAGRVPWTRPVRMGLTSAPRGADEEMLRTVEKALGGNWSLQRFPSYSNLVDALCEDEIELAWLPPVAYLRARKLGPVHLLLALARGGRASYGSALIASSRAGITALEDVRGKRVVWVDVWSAAGYLMPRSVLREAGLDPAQVFASQSFVGSHGAVIDALESGRADLGATYCTLDDDGALVAAPWSDRPTLRPIALSGAIPGDAICAAGELSLKDAEAIVEPLLQLSLDPAGGALLKKLFGTDRFAEVDGSYYQALEGV
jgi:phosphate/phosphite/phosphonate ABC transporter binding protein